MPEGTTVVSAEAFGYSAWTITARVTAILSDGTPKKYFLKVPTLPLFFHFGPDLLSC